MNTMSDTSPMNRYFDRGGSSISGKGVHIYIKVWGFALLVSSRVS